MKRIVPMFVLLLCGAMAFGQGNGQNRGQDRGQGRGQDQGQDPWSYRDHANWDRSWNQRPMPRSGACFFKDTQFQGDRFCVNQSDKLESLPGNFGDKISSIQLFGKARVTVYNDRNFSGGGQEFRKSIPDLRTQKFRGGHTWNDRISSMMVR